jgi:probable F420-dependent oxidoreductase
MPGTYIPPDRDTLATFAELAARSEASGYDRIWIGETNDVDPVIIATLALGATERAKVALFLNVFTRAPTTLAVAAATLARLAPDRVEIALGVGSPVFVERWNGIPYRDLYARLRDTLRFLRMTLGGERVREPFPTIAGSGFALSLPPGQPPTLLLTATGTRALALAAKEADGVILNWVAPADLERVESLPERSAVSLVIPVCPTPDRELVDRTMRTPLVNYFNIPGYADQQRRLGRAEQLDEMWRAWDAGDRAAAHAALPAEVLDELVVWGEPAACRARLEEIERTTSTRAIGLFFPPPGTTYADVAL